MTKPVHQIFEEAFKQHSSYVILNAAREIVGRIAIQYSSSGQCRAFVHFLGAGMSMSNWTKGGGYDKQTAAVEEAVQNLEYNPNNPADYDIKAGDRQLVLKLAFSGDTKGLHHWSYLVRKAGFDLANVT